jgi:hypothetical protein
MTSMKDSRVKYVSLICVAFIVGILAGAWLEWYTWRASGQVIVYQVEPYNQADLMVKQGDQIYLQHPNSTQTTTDLQMNFPGGDSPCTNGSGHDHCVVGASKTGGEYLFSCSTAGDPNGDQCPDPGTQQVPTNPPPNPKHMYFKDIWHDLEYVFGFHFNPQEWEVQQYRANLPQTQPAAAAATGAYSYVDCNQTTKTTELTPPQMTVQSGKTITWGTHDTLTFSETGFCAQAPTQNSGNSAWSCTAGNVSSSTNYTYTVKMASCTNPSVPATITVTP